MIRSRYLEPFIAEDMKSKMIFIGGPRQVGKTTLAKHLGASCYSRISYLNWDYIEHRRQIMRGELDSRAKLIIFDEIHKYRPWKNLIKGFYDMYRSRFHFLVTGSARLDLYRQGGDSLFGRYHYYRLHPFSVAEMLSRQLPMKPFHEIVFPSGAKAIRRHYEALFHFGGFPEPLFKQEARTLRRWQNERLERIIKEDIRDIELVRDIDSLYLMGEILPEKVGSPFSLNALREDFQVTHKTIARWVSTLERFYYHFRLAPFMSTAIKSLRKEPKLYLWDWSQVNDASIRLENLVASHLLKFVHALHDRDGYKAELFFVRDREGREVDFLVTVQRKPWFLVEVKTALREPSKTLLYFQRKLKVPFSYQLTQEENIDHFRENVRMMSVDTFLAGLI